MCAERMRWRCSAPGGQYLDRPPGSVVYTQFLNPDGGIESDLTVTLLAPDHFRVVTGSNFVASDLGLDGDAQAA